MPSTAHSVGAKITDCLSSALDASQQPHGGDHMGLCSSGRKGAHFKSWMGTMPLPQTEPEDRATNACRSSVSWEAEGRITCDTCEDGTFTAQAVHIQMTRLFPLLQACSLHDFIAFPYNLPSVWQQARLADTSVSPAASSHTNPIPPQSNTAPTKLPNRKKQPGP